MALMIVILRENSNLKFFQDPMTILMNSFPGHPAFPGISLFIFRK